MSVITAPSPISAPLDAGAARPQRYAVETTGRGDVLVRAPARTGHRIEAWLSALVDVVEVRPG